MRGALERMRKQYHLRLSKRGVMDGMRRVLKKSLAELLEIDDVQFEQDPDPHYVDVDPDDLPY